MNDMIKTARVTGFTLVEVMVATMLSALLLVMVSGVWTGFGRSMADASASSAITSSAALASQSFRRDLSGHLPGSPTGRVNELRLVGRAIVGERLMLCFDGSPPNGQADWSTTDVIVEYRLSGDQLLRTDQGAGDVFVVANGVSGFVVTDIGSGLRIELSLTRRDLTRTYTFVSQDPS